MDLIRIVQKGINLISETDQESKIEGLNLLTESIKRKELLELGYDKLIFKELIKLAQFEEDCLEETLYALESNFFKEEQYHDELAEMLIYRVARSTKFDVCKICLTKLSSLVDYFDESIAKHSKQILKLADFNDMVQLNPLIIDILKKMETKLPRRVQYDSSALL